MLKTPLTVINCPSRRQLAAYPSYLSNNSSPNFANGTAFNPTTGTGGPGPPLVAKTDYAANGGDTFVCPLSNNSGIPGWGPTSYASGLTAAWLKPAQIATGPIFCASEVSMAQVTDGASNTYLIGEKHLMPDNYYNGNDDGDNENAYMGDDQDILRYGGPSLPGTVSQDTPGYMDDLNFGSVHSTGFGVVMCDGSVRVISFLIDPITHARLANRADGLPLDPTKY